MKKEELSQAIFGRQVDEETLAYRVFGRPVHPSMTFEETFEMFDLAHKANADGTPHPDGARARDIIMQQDALWADEMKAYGPYCQWPRIEEEFQLGPGEEIIESQMLTYDEFLERQKAEEESSFPGLGQMAKNLVITTTQALTNKPVTGKTIKKRLEVCRACPSFDAKSERCRECGCFMPMKASVGGDPDQLCPLKKWSDL